MKFLWLLSAAFVGVALGRPSQGGYHLTPRRAVMISGYYSNPLFGRSFDITPHGSMSAIVTRDTVATNAYSGDIPQYPPVDVLPVEENETVEKYTEKAPEIPPTQYIPPEAPVQSPELQEAAPTLPVQQEAAEEPAPSVPAQPQVEVAQEELQHPLLVEEIPQAEEVSTAAAPVAKVTRRTAKKVKPPPVQADDEEEEDEGLPSYWPFAGGKGAVPSYNAFFPITISGASGARSRSQGQDDEYNPGSATAIANSFSTGKGGIATSHATSFGDPYLASLIRKGLFNLGSQKA